LGSAGVPPLGIGSMIDPKKHAPPHLCYLAERGRSALKGVGINGGKLQNWQTLGLCLLGMGDVVDP